jgi:uncharacterized RDD family membrane protein YckC
MLPDVAPTLTRRFACLAYEALPLAAILFIAGFLVVGLMPAEPSPLVRILHQLYLFIVSGLYFTWFWRHGGQTLAMKTWRIRLERVDGGVPRLGQAWLRYLLAVLGLLGLGLGFLWAVIDPDRQFLHDRVARTRLVRAALG